MYDLLLCIGICFKTPLSELLILHQTDNDSRSENMEKEGHAEISRGSPAKDMSVVVRRSGRLKNLVSSGPSNEGPVRTVDLNTDDSDDSDDSDDEPPQHTDGLNTEPSPVEGGMEEKIDFLVQSAVELTAKVSESLNSWSLLCLNYHPLLILISSSLVS